jgi:hypothetical protein
MEKIVTIDAVEYNAELIAIANDAIAHNDNRKINMNDAEVFFNKIKESPQYDDLLKNTIFYIRENYKWDATADKWLRKEIRTWAAYKGHQKI